MCCQLCLSLPQDEGEVVGDFHKHFCNHWLSREALRTYLLTEAEQQRFTFACPVCVGEPCGRCAAHAGRDGAARKHCYVRPMQLRRILTPEEHDRYVATAAPASYFVGGLWRLRQRSALPVRCNVVHFQCK